MERPMLLDTGMIRPLTRQCLNKGIWTRGEGPGEEEANGVGMPEKGERSFPGAPTIC
jgi:hypothetical protein